LPIELLIFLEMPNFRIFLLTTCRDIWSKERWLLRFQGCEIFVNEGRTVWRFFSSSQVALDARCPSQWTTKFRISPTFLGQKGSNRRFIPEEMNLFRNNFLFLE
jgi:hypothetical protein